jgi:hypothetical protein
MIKEARRESLESRTAGAKANDGLIRLRKGQAEVDGKRRTNGDNTVRGSYDRDADMIAWAK